METMISGGFVSLFNFHSNLCSIEVQCEQLLIVTCAHQIENLIPREDLFRGCGLISVTGWRKRCRTSLELFTSIPMMEPRFVSGTRIEISPRSIIRRYLTHQPVCNASWIFNAFAFEDNCKCIRARAIYFRVTQLSAKISWNW